VVSYSVIALSSTATTNQDTHANTWARRGRGFGFFLKSWGRASIRLARLSMPGFALRNKSSLTAGQRSLQKFSALIREFLTISHLRRRQVQQYAGCESSGWVICYLKQEGRNVRNWQQQKKHYKKKQTNKKKTGTLN
jgi:hypothetical protein